MTRETQLGFQPPAIGEEEIAAVSETLRSGWLSPPARPRCTSRSSRSGSGLATR